jgi:hypothetical protein
LFAVGLALVAATITPAAVASDEGANPLLAAPGVQHTALDDLHLVGAAVKTQRGNVRLVNRLSSTGQIGAAYTDTPVSVGSFTATMTFHIKGPCSDGIALIVQNQGPNALGGPGDDIGYGRAIGGAPEHGPNTGGVIGINHSLAFMLDSWQNTWDSPVPYLGMQTRSPKQNDPRPEYSLARAQTTPVNDGLDHTLTVQYDGTTIQVTYDGTELVDQALDLSTLLDLPDGTAYVGVTAANGGCTSNIAITAFDVTT